MKQPMVRIMNCRKGSFAWWHEKRHTEQEKRWGLLSSWTRFDEVFKLLALVSVVFQQWFFASFFVIALWSFDFVLEFDADWFALKKTGNWKAWLRLVDTNGN